MQYPPVELYYFSYECALVVHIAKQVAVSYITTNQQTHNGAFGALEGQ